MVRPQRNTLSPCVAGVPRVKSNLPSAYKCASAIAGVQSIVLTDAFGAREAYGLLMSATANEVSRNAYWPWIVSNFEAITQKIPDQWRRNTPRLAQYFCSQQGIAAVEKLYAEQGQFTPGYQRALDQTVESLQLCVALAPQGLQLVSALPGAS